MRIVTVLTHSLAAAALLLAGAVGQLAATQADDASIKRQDQREVVEVYCPAEDSCALDYDGDLNAWVVRAKAAGSW